MTDIQIATDAANTLIGLISDHVERVQIAGSIRRGKPNPKDAEIVAIPKLSLLSYLDDLERRGHIRKALYGDTKTPRWGNSYRGIDIDGVKCELFLATPETWGYIYWLRTGPGDANTRVMSLLIKRSAGLRFKGGAAWYSPGRKWAKPKREWVADDAVQVPTPTEQDVFNLLGLPFIEPAQRSVQTYARYFNDAAHTFGVPEIEMQINPFPLQGTLFDLHSLEAITGYDADDPGPTANSKKITTYQWGWPHELPDGRVWVHIGYGQYVALPQADSRARAYLKMLQTVDDKSRRGMMEHLANWLEVDCERT